MSCPIRRGLITHLLVHDWRRRMQALLHFSVQADVIGGNDLQRSPSSIVLVLSTSTNQRTSLETRPVQQIDICDLVGSQYDVVLFVTWIVDEAANSGDHTHWMEKLGFAKGDEACV